MASDTSFPVAIVEMLTHWFCESSKSNAFRRILSLTSWMSLFGSFVPSFISPSEKTMIEFLYVKRSSGLKERFG